MAKATLKLPTGAEVHIEGTADEIKSLLTFYGAVDAQPAKRIKKAEEPAPSSADEVSLPEIINAIKNSDEAEQIEKNILDRTSQVDRALLPLFVVHEHFKNKIGLTTGDISQVCRQLGIPISTANVSHTLAGTASKYVVGDSVRKRGQPMKYKLTRRGVQYLRSVITGSNDA